MSDAIYESIAKLIVKANEFRKTENISAKNDYDSLKKDITDEKIGKAGIISENVMNASDYSAYLNRLSSAEDVKKALTDEAATLTEKGKYLSKISDAESKMEQAGIQAQNEIKTDEWNYQKERDKKADYFYELRQDVEEQKESTSNKNSSTGSSSSGGNKTTTTKKENKEETLKGADYINKMPAFCGGTSLKDRLNNEVYSQKFKEKALQISSNGTKKATSGELNALVKMAEKYGASDAYIKWIHNVCGYG